MRRTFRLRTTRDSGVGRRCRFGFRAAWVDSLSLLFVVVGDVDVKLGLAGSHMTSSLMGSTSAPEVSVPCPGLSFSDARWR